jgi:hypothetical protein
MPIRKLRLNAAEARQTSSFISQLCAEGVDLGADSEILAVADEVCPLEITQGRDVGVVCEVPPLNVAVAIPICIVARRRVIVKDYDIELPWGPVDLPYLRERDGHYCFGRLRYPSREVLNDHFDNAFSMRPGAIREGVIVGYSCEPIPEDVKGEVVPVQFTIVDTLGREAREADFQDLVRASQPIAPGLGTYAVRWLFALENSRESAFHSLPLPARDDNSTCVISAERVPLRSRLPEQRANFSPPLQRRPFPPIARPTAVSLPGP